MKAHIFSIFLVVSMSSLLSGQDTSFQWRMAHSVENLSTLDIPTGLLANRTFQFLNYDQFRGMPDSTCMNGEWEQLYLEMFNSAFRRDTLGLPFADEVDSIAASNARATFF